MNKPEALAYMAERYEEQALAFPRLRETTTLEQYQAANLVATMRIELDCPECGSPTKVGTRGRYCTNFAACELAPN